MQFHRNIKRLDNEDSLRQNRRNLNVRNLLSFYIRSLTPWQDHGEYACYPFKIFFHLTDS
jgi:hypothetical protein